MEVYDFLPTYIDFNKDIEDILGIELVDKTSLYHKKEFHDYKLQKIEEKPNKPGEYMNHQIIMSRFLSSNTPYKGILVMHEPGTGKTCLSVSVIEKIRVEQNSFRGALILMKGNTLINNYKKELVDQCTDGIYKTKDENGTLIGYEDSDKLIDPDLTENKIKRRINKNLDIFYQFQTFEVFSKQIKNMRNEDIIKNYSNLIIVIDEAHHLRTTEKDTKSQYDEIFRFLHTIENSKTILMTGTPMIDDSSEIASLMNLILDDKNQLPIGEDFVKEYMIKNDKDINIINPDKEEELKEKLHGKVSFLRSMQSSVQREFVGKKIDLTYFNQFGLSLENFQLDKYKNAIQEDIDTKGIYINSREASLFIFPDGTYGKRGFETYSKTVNHKTVIKQTLFDMFKDKNNDEKLKELSKYSIKYANCIKLILENEGNHFVYLDFVQGSGAIIFAELLKQFGFSNFKSGGSGFKFALLTSKTSSDINKAIKIFNQKDNVNGKKIKVIIGTKIISEGFTLKNVRHVHILTPHWNFSETDQAIARAFRLFSHNEVEKNIPNLIVKIYLYTILTGDKDIVSIDQYMYKFCEDKDISIKSIEHLLKQVSFDCRLNKLRNVLSNKLNYSRNCEYQKCDYVCYKDDDDEKLDYSTFNLFYDQPDIDKMIEEIKELFLKKSFYSMDEIKLIFKNYNYTFLVKTILYMIEHKITITIKGIYFFIHYEHDIIYLSSTIKDSNILNLFYTNHIPLQLYFDFNKEIDKIYDNYLAELFNKLKEETDEDEKNKIITKFTKSAQELLLEISILSREKDFKDINPIREYIIDKFSEFIKIGKDNEIIISTLLGKDNYRCLDKLVWIDCNPNIKFKNKKEKEKEKEEEKEKDINGYTAYYEKDIFKIKEIQKDQPKDKRKMIKGINCSLSIKKPKLLQIIYQLKIHSENYKKYDKYNDEKLKEILSTKEELKEFKDINLNRDDLVRLVYWENESKGNICKSIENFFKEKGII